MKGHTGPHDDGGVNWHDPHRGVTIKEIIPLSPGYAYSFYSFPLDHFGLVASPLIQALVNQAGDKRKRKSALGNLVKMAKVTAQIPKEKEVEYVGLLADKAGQLTLSFAVRTLYIGVDWAETKERIANEQL
jgi:hypothetical protein